MQDWRYLVAPGLALLFAAGCVFAPGLAAVFRAAVLRRPRPPVLGPLFWYELTALARRGRQSQLRVLFSAVLLVGMLVAYLNEFREENPIRLVVGLDQTYPINRMSAFAQRYAAIFLVCQLAAVVLITPVYAGGSVTEEKDRGTLEFLRASMLDGRELVAAKLSARLVFVYGLILTGAPILFLTLHFGGVSSDMLIAAYTIAFTTALSLAAFALWLGIRRPTLRDVLYWCYGVIAALTMVGFCCGWCLNPLAFLSPFTATTALFGDPSTVTRVWFDPPIGVILFVAAHGTAAVVFTTLATIQMREKPPEWRPRVARIRQMGSARRGADARPRYVPIPDEDRATRRRERPARRGFDAPRIGHTDPLVWKERYFAGRAAGLETGLAGGCGIGLIAAALLPLGIWLFVAMYELVGGSREVAPILNPLVKVCGFAAAVALAPFAGFRAVAAVTRERERQTLTALFTLPLPRKELLVAKWKVAALWMRYWAAGLFVIAVFGAITGSVHPTGLLVAALLLAAFVPFVVTLALWLSVRCGSTARAATWYLVILLTLFLAPLLLATLTRAAVQLTGDTKAGDEAEYLVSTVSVPYAVWESLFRADGRPAWSPQSEFVGESFFAGGLAAAAAVALVYAAATFGLWRHAVRTFDREGK